MPKIFKVYFAYKKENCEEHGYHGSMQEFPTRDDARTFAKHRAKGYKSIRKAIIRKENSQVGIKKPKNQLEATRLMVS
jgi:hypothetical protein